MNTDKSNQKFSRISAQSTEDNWLEPGSLRIGLLRSIELIDIEDPVPYLSWSFKGAGYDSRQTACEVLIATDPSLLEPGKADIWSSGKINTPLPRLQIPPEILSSNTGYWWTVRLWNPSDKPSSFADPQAFVTGTLSAEARTARPPRVQTAVSPVQIIQNANANCFVDFGKAAFGTLRFKAPSAVGGEPVTVHLGEKRGTGDSVDRTPGGTIRYLQIETTLMPGDQWTQVTIPDYKDWPAVADMPIEIGQVLPFRYAEISGLPELLSESETELLAVHTPWDEEASSFNCSDSVLNQVWKLCKYSIKATTFAGVYVDGDRERLPYEADAYINQLAHYGVEPAYALARFSHEYLLDHPTWPTEWRHHSILMAWYDWQYTGDTRSLERNYTKLQEKLFPGAERADELIAPSTTDIVDWPVVERDGYQLLDYNTVVNAFQYAALRCMADIATVLDQASDAVTYTARANTLYNSFNTVFWDTANGRYIDGEGSTHASLHANFFPLTFGLVPADRKPSVTTFVHSRGMACSVYGAYHLLEGLFANFQSNEAVDLMRSTDIRSWHNMIQVGSTVTLEAWDSSFKPNLDWNHAWGAAPAGIIPRQVLGIRPLSPGFDEMIIQPQLGSLEWIEGKVPTPLGPVDLYLKINDNKLTGTVTTPPGCTFTLDLPVPDGSAGHLTLSGEAVPATATNGRIVLAGVPTGSYTFEVN